VAPVRPRVRLGVTQPGGPPAFLHPFARPAAEAGSYIKIVRASGAHVWDDLGNRYIDALASLWYCNAGHGRPEIVSAIVSQLQKLDTFHAFERFTNEPAEELTRALVALAPMADARVFLTSGGSEAVETAVKLARMAHALAGQPERTVVVSRRPSYHGVTYAALSATGLPLNQEGFGPMVPDVVQVPYDSLDALDAVLAERGDEVAAVLAEPVVGAGGVLPPPPGYLEGLRSRCDSVGAFLILDEVICGFGRLGRWWGSLHYDVEPDLVPFAKGVTSGYQPLGGVLVGRRVRAPLEAEPGFVLRHGHTYSGHPVPCAAAVANIAVLRDEGLCERADHIGSVLGGGLADVAALRPDLVVDVRGVAGIWAVGLAEGVDAAEVRDELLARGVICRPLGGSALAFCPPLMIDDADLAQIVDALAEAVKGIAPAV